MRPRPRSLTAVAGAFRVGFASAGVALLVASSAAAQELQLPKPEEVETGTIRPAAPDTRSGHFYFSGGIGATGPAGLMSASTAASYLAGAGLTASGSLGFGLSRHASLHILGDYTLFNSPGACTTGCSGHSFSVGLGLKYHLTQGIAFDPWASYGLAFRSSSFLAIVPSAGTINSERHMAGDKVTEAYRGIDIARIAFGGDFYPTPWLGFGPFLEVDVGTNFAYPILYPDPYNPKAVPQDQVGLRPYAFFQVGFRVAFDPMRKASTRVTAQGRRPATPGSAPEPPAKAAAISIPLPGF